MLANDIYAIMSKKAGEKHIAASWHPAYKYIVTLITNPPPG